ncbi:RDD family protein [Actinomadura kijaniata]|uniref:RDD family protein n=1 Tax=Actinomadura kijaniata TaxID=46161 RepID=UPI003F1AAC8F
MDGEVDGAGRVLAEPGQRLLARIVDTMVVGLPVVMVMRETLPGRVMEVAAPVAVAGLLLVYEAVQLALWGRTVGKRVAGVEVVRVPPPADPGADPGAGAPPSRLGVGRSVLRAAVYALPITVRPVPFLGVAAGILWVVNAAAVFEGSWGRGGFGLPGDARLRQAVHDRLAGTLVVKARSPQ